MNSTPSPADQAIRRAYQALQNGNLPAARRWAQRAAALAPEREDPWLILARVACPRASLGYLVMALRINPASLRARQGMDWARLRLPPAIKPQKGRPLNQPIPAGRAILFLLLAVILISFGFLVMSAWVFRPALSRQTPPASAYEGALAPPSPTPPSSPLLLNEAAPRATTEPSPSPTLPPRASSTFTAAVPLQPFVTPTFASTAMPIQTTAAANTYTVKTGDTLGKVAANFGVDVFELIRLNQISNPLVIYPGQKLAIPGLHTISPPVTQNPQSIVVILSEQRLYAFQGSDLVFSALVSTGQNGGTLTGSFNILEKIDNAWSDPWGFWMPYWMGIYYAGPDMENGFHALPVLPDGQTLWGDSLGTPASYGCVVLGTADARRLYEWAAAGTLVEIRP